MNIVMVAIGLLILIGMFAMYFWGKISPILQRIRDSLSYDYTVDIKQLEQDDAVIELAEFFCDNCTCARNENTDKAADAILRIMDKRVTQEDADYTSIIQAVKLISNTGLLSSIESSNERAIMRCMRILCTFSILRVDDVATLNEQMEPLNDWIRETPSLSASTVWAYSFLCVAYKAGDTEDLIRHLIVKKICGVVLRASRRKEKGLFDKEMEMSALLWAAGACSNDTSLTDSEEKATEYENELKKEHEQKVNKRNEIVSKLEEFADEWRSLNTNGYLDTVRQRQVMLNIEMAKASLERADDELLILPVLHLLTKPDIGVLYILAMIVRDKQHFGEHVRQGAIKGMKCWLERVPENENVKQIVDDAVNGLGHNEIRIPLGGSVLESAQHIYEELTCINSGFAQFRTVLDTIQKISMHVPRFLEFISAFPLRLFTQAKYSNYLGYFRLEGNLLEYWYRYVPPEKVGQVLERYLMIDDKTRPNSMGIMNELFHDSALVLPVLYHEFLHFSGTTGNGNKPIPNEAEVWFREQIYFRYLLAIQNYTPQHMGHVAEIQWRYIGLFGAASFFKTIPPADPAYINNLNQLITALYGPQLNKGDAEEFAERQIVSMNNATKEMNLEIEWCPEVTWPPLIEDDSNGRADGESRTELKNLIVNRKMQRNTITIDDQQRILNEDAVREQLNIWQDYHDKICKYIEIPIK